MMQGAILLESIELGLQVVDGRCKGFDEGNKIGGSQLGHRGGS